MTEKYCVYEEAVGKEICRIAGLTHDDILKVMREHPGVGWSAMLLTLAHRVATIATNAALGYPLDRMESDSPQAEVSTRPEETVREEGEFAEKLLTALADKFGVARPTFKRWITGEVVPEPAFQEYVLAALRRALPQPQSSEDKHG